MPRYVFSMISVYSAEICEVFVRGCFALMVIDVLLKRTKQYLRDILV